MATIVGTHDRLRTLALVAAATAVGYLVWLGWHTLEDASAYAEWRVIGLALTWATIVVVGSWRGHGAGTPVVAVLALLVVWCADASTTPSDDASLWPIGAMFLLVGSALAGTVLAAATVTARHLNGRRSPPRS